MNMSKVYVLALENNKYYVGRTNDVERRYNEHVCGRRSSAWTRKYKPIKILEIINNCDCFEEDKVTIKYMSEFGISCVRGASYVTLTLSPETIDHIHRRIRMALDLCVNCGSNEHFVTKCNYTKNRKRKYDEYCLTCTSRTHFTEDCEFQNN